MPRSEKLSSAYTLSAQVVEEKMAREDYEERAAKEALEEAERIRSEASMDGGMGFTEIIRFSNEQQKGVESKARKSRRRNSRLDPNAVQTGGISTKNVVGSTGKRGGTNDRKRDGANGRQRDYPEQVRGQQIVAQ